MPQKRGYLVTVEWSHKQKGPQVHHQRAEGSSARRALNSTLLAFFRDKSKRRERRDAHVGFRCMVWRIPK